MHFTVTYREVGALATIEVQKPGHTVESRPWRRMDVEHAYDRITRFIQDEIETLACHHS